MQPIVFDLAKLTTICFFIVEAFKLAKLPSSYAPLLSLVVGMVLATLAKLDLLTGLLIGVLASGAYSQSKTHIESIRSYMQQPKG